MSVSQETQERRIVWVRNRMQRTFQRWRQQQLIDVSPQAEAGIMRWVLTGKADDPLEPQINPPVG